MGSLKEGCTRPTGVKNDEFVSSSGKLDGPSPQMAPALRDGESEVLKDSRQVFLVCFFLGRVFSGQVLREKIMVVASECGLSR